IALARTREAGFNATETVQSAIFVWSHARLHRGGGRMRQSATLGIAAAEHEPCGALRQARSDDPDARRRETLHGDLCAARHVARVSDHAVSHALQRGAVWDRRLSREAGAIAALYGARLCLCLPGRARAIHVGGGLP